jgi:hypothetical protein
MSSDNPPSIYYFLIANQINGKEIGTFLDNSDTRNNINDFNQIIATSKDLLHSNNSSLKGKKNKYTLEFHNIYYMITPSDTFYLAAVRKNSLYCKQENLIFELMEDIDHQGIKKLVDKNGELTNVGKQNLKFSIEKYTESNKSKLTSFNNNNELFENTSNPNENNKPNKITMVTSQINEIKKDVKSSLKNMITNISDMEELDSKSLKIKEQSYKFQQDSLNLERKLKWQNLRNKIIIGLIILFIIIIIYVLI